jgi:anhydro-N-acetylmuramic acid kinase
MLIIGLMSGTSLDGIDAALVKTNGTPESIERLSYFSLPYDENSKILFKALTYALQQYKMLNSAEEIISAAESNFSTLLIEFLTATYGKKHTKQKNLELTTYLGELPSIQRIVEHSTNLHIKAVKRLLEQNNITASQINAIGYHGQTFLFDPERQIAIILGNVQELANTFCTKIVYDFRTDDICKGGKGAPLAPLYHFALAKQANKLPLAMINCGGISNLTYIPSADEKQIISFDTGVGNYLLDKLVREETNNCEVMDKDGKYSLQGMANKDALKTLLAKSISKNENYFLQPPPKALDISDISMPKELDLLSFVDKCATLAAFTAECICQGIQHLVKPIPLLWVIAGGGAKNPAILRELETRLKAQLGKEVCLVRAEDISWNSSSMEAELFAYLAARHLSGLTISLPNTTGTNSMLTKAKVCKPLPQNYKAQNT